MNYNLLEEKWIPVLYKDGITSRLNILEAFTHASRIREIAASNPMDRVAILRFLVALIHWCGGYPPEGKGSEPSLLPGLFKKLKENQKCFDLFGEDKPFYQDCGAGGKLAAVTNLLHDLPSGTNIAHFRHIRDFRDGLCPACCAMGLLRWSTVASAGTAGRGASMTAGLNGNTPAYCFRVGKNLLDTLSLNRPSDHPLEGDLPVWGGATEASPPGFGFLKAMTWQSRRVLLAPPDENGQRDLCCGDCCYCSCATDQLVRSVLFRPGWQRPSRGPWPNDPQLLRVATGSEKAKAVTPSLASPDQPLEAQANLWRPALQGLLQRLEGSGCAPALFHVGLVGASQQLYKDALMRSVRLPRISMRALGILLEEEAWLGRVIWSAASPRTADWHKRPRGHRVIEALCSEAAKGQAIRSSFCEVSFLVGEELEGAFMKLAADLASDQCGPDSEAGALQGWKQAVGEILCGHARRAADLTSRGSPLRRIVARDRAILATRNALRRTGAERKEATQ